jgi:Heterokaryon incompatibility protein (HET)
MVGSIEGKHEPRLIESRGQAGRYVALIHCWGSSKPIRTESPTYQKHLRGMPFECLPKTFQDTITVTRALNVPFLWIDSLCIIQDSTKDWEHECQKMPAIYTNSVVTIAGPAAADCEAGFLHRRPVADQGSIDLRWQVSNSATPYDVTLQSIGDRFIGPEPEDDSALGKRAWVLQERLLSPRVLYFGTKRMFWECFTDRRYEDMHYPVAVASKWAVLEKTSFNVADNRPEWWRFYWYQIVNAYTATTLAFNCDRFPALLALVSVVQTKIDDVYVAGLWKKDMCRDLAWCSRGKDLDEAMLHDHDQYIAPSWSWASARNAVNYADHISIEDPKEGTDQVLDIQLERSGPESLGQLGGGYIAIRGMTATGVIRIRSYEFAPEIMDLSFCDDDGGQDANILGASHSDDPRISVIFPDRKTGSAQADDLFSLKRNILVLHLRTATLGSGQLMWAAMAVEPHPTFGDGCWQRIGLVQGHSISFRCQDPCLKYLGRQR